MTTTTRTTRKAPWAVFLTALLAALALVLGSMVIAAPANAKDNPKPDNPGNSANAPGHQDGTFVPPGHDPEFVPPGQEVGPNGDQKVWVCHADTNKGQGNTNLGHEVNDLGTGGQNKTGFNILYISWDAWVNGHETRHPADDVFMDEATAQAHCGTRTTCPDGVTPIPADGICPTPPKYCPDKVTLLPADGICPTPPPQACPTGTARVGTAMDHVYDPMNAADLAFCAIQAEDAAAIDAAVAAAIPQPATVAAPAPGTIKVPAKGPIVPATVPAGDGSTAPTTPVAALTFLVLAATALAASTVRLVGAKR